jgi:hypothetical protein
VGGDVERGVTRAGDEVRPGQAEVERGPLDLGVDAPVVRAGIAGEDGHGGDALLRDG